MAPYNEDDLFIKSKENELNEANAENEVLLYLILNRRCL